MGFSKSKEVRGTLRTLLLSAIITDSPHLTQSKLLPQTWQIGSLHLRSLTRVSLPYTAIISPHSCQTLNSGNTEPKASAASGDDGPRAGDDFLRRERALLGDDAAQFASSNDKAATVDDGDNDLLGDGGGSYRGPAAGGEAEVANFESAFPAMDTQNQVNYSEFIKCCLSNSYLERWTWRHDQRINTPLPAFQASSVFRQQRRRRRGDRVLTVLSLPHLMINYLAN